MDLFTTEKVVLAPFRRALISTGIILEIPEGYAGFIQPRSGLAINDGFTILNSPGLIDAGYRGEIKIIGINLDPESWIILEPGDKVAQLVIMKIERADFEVEFNAERDNRGFGSTK